jgi:hypothetical protein
LRASGTCGGCWGVLDSIFGHYFGHFGHFSDSFYKNKNHLQILTKLFFFFILNEYLYNVQNKISSRLRQHLQRLLT